ncbi:hypothetical protein AgCh_033388 [Apium graveolens]
MPLPENTSELPISTTELSSNSTKKSNLANLTTPQKGGATTTKQEATGHQYNFPATVHHRRAYKSSENHQRSTWRDGAINASAHEVPSGPNPISNRMNAAPGGFTTQVYHDKYGP